eukprot:NODE_15355_length_1054_cov_7.996764.p2 GENE.NODE_15355_length_1054_cov_7.996764~~NODE_15355_length_1054_cov_7.996764.p2  ORF type:complete len:283 (-),score=33.73 NODE_15355_length_1054_cov_7.996764:119-967(-)
MADALMKSASHIVSATGISKAAHAAGEMAHSAMETAAHRASEFVETATEMVGAVAHTASVVVEEGVTSPAEEGNPRVTLDTDMGQIEIEILCDQVPITASSFLDLVEKGFYDGLHFHRVIEYFMVQVGCPLTRELEKNGALAERAGTGGPDPGSTFECRSSKTTRRREGGYIKDEENTQTKQNTEGTVSMSHSGREHSVGSQFFINVVNNRNLDWDSEGPSKHTVFGKVTTREGLEVAKEISRVKTRNDRPKEPFEPINDRPEKPIKLHSIFPTAKGPRPAL